MPLLVNRMYFRYGKTVILSVCLGSCFAIGQPDSLHQAPSKSEHKQEFADTPSWAKGMVWYQVFPERFRNGNPSNDPAGWDLFTAQWDQGFDEVTVDEVEAMWIREQINPRRFGSDPSRPGGVAQNLIYARRYGGDLQGVYEKLDQLVDLGVTGVYLCPVFSSRSLHKYDAWDHRHIDPTLGHPGEYADPGPIDLVLDQAEDPFDETTWSWTPADRCSLMCFYPRPSRSDCVSSLTGSGTMSDSGIGHSLM
ncbi:MAG: hypothetical protein JKY96_06130 [Phycisphaerales bacterium]|nr:hypothetical protein [Phycisphaerales bacterium]